MKESNIVKAYAKALIKLAEEQKIDTAEEMTRLNILINESNDLETLLFLDVFTGEEKKSVLEVIFQRLSFSNLFKNFLFFLLEEKRFSLFPLIYKEVIVIDDFKKGFMRGTVESAEDQIDERVVEKLKILLEQKLGLKADLTFVKNPNISAGFKVTVGDLQLDASLERQLELLKQSIFE